MKKYFSLLALLLLPIFSSAFYIELFGQVIEHFSTDPVKDVYIRVYADDVQKFFKRTKSNGKFKFQLEREVVYTIEFVKEYMITKKLQVDTRNIPAVPDAPFFEMELEMDLFPYVEEVDYGIFKEPLGLAKYNAALGNMSWDGAYKRKYGAMYANFWWHYERAFYEKRTKHEKIPQKPQNWPAETGGE